MSRTFTRIVLALVLSAVAGLALAVPAGAQNMPIPSVSLNFGDGSGEPGKVAVVMQLLLLLTVLSLAPAILMMVTSFTRIVVVLSILRHALGTQQMPANQIIVGLALFSDVLHHDARLAEGEQRRHPAVHERADLDRAGL